MRSLHFVCPVNLLYRENQPWLRGWLYTRLGCSEAAADLAQDTFLRLLKSDNLPPPHDARRFLTRIAKGLIIDAYRRQKVEEAYLESLRHLPENFGVNPETQHLIIETLIEIDALLDGLPVRVRKALLLRQIDGLSYAAIADQFTALYSASHTPVGLSYLAQYRTGTGEIQSFNLEDGTVLTLNTNSAVDATFSLTGRQIELHQGEVLIQTGAESPRRPFVVNTRFRQIEALGTLFNVRLCEHQAHLAVLQNPYSARCLRQDLSLSCNEAILSATPREMFRRMSLMYFMVVMSQRKASR